MKKLIIFIFVYGFTSCTSDKTVNNDKAILTELEIVKSKTNKVEIGYYVNLRKTPIAKVAKSGGLDESLLKYIDFIGDLKKVDTCKLNFGENIPEGHITLLKDTVILVQLDFVLTGSCQGFYTDFSKNRKVYEISSVGITELIKLKNQTENNFH